MRSILRWLVVSSFLLIQGAASAIGFEFIEVGDVYYLDRHMDSKVLVVVLGLDASARLVKVRARNGAVDWVSPGRLLSQSQYEERAAQEDLQALRQLGCLFDTTLCAEAPWVPGSRLSGNPNVIASAVRNKWMPAPGYRWAEPQTTSMAVQWSPGKPHPKYGHVIAGADADMWQPENGYNWAQPNTFGPVRWRPGTPHRDAPYIVAGPTPGKWKPVDGFIWRNPGRKGDYSVVRQ